MYGWVRKILPAFQKYPRNSAEYWVAISGWAINIAISLYDSAVSLGFVLDFLDGKIGRGYFSGKTKIKGGKEGR